MKTLNLLKKIFIPNTSHKTSQESTAETENIKNPVKLFKNLDDNLNCIKKSYSLPENSDIKIRQFKIGGKVSAFILFVEGLIRDDAVSNNILAPLMLLPEKEISLAVLKEKLILNGQITEATDFSKVFDEVNMGNCLLFADGISTAVSIDVKGWDRRGIDSPITEHVIYGPHEGFNENFKVNTALVRKNLRSENLVCETLSLGNISKTPCALMYIKGVTNSKHVEEIKRRIKNIDADYIYQSGELEQFLEDSTFSLSPQFLTTERPDKTSEALTEGKIALLMHGSPFALIAPVAFSDFLTTTEDKYVRFPFANLMKFIRLIGIVSSFLLSGLYIAIVNFHHEMIPTALLFSIESAREAVPFSSLFELLLMEVAFDIIREASLRVPSPIGSTVGIIGGLIVGQAAVSANLVSPIAIIIVSLTGIGSFATPNYSLNFTFRFARYLYIFLGARYGFFGIATGIFLHTALLCSVNSLGVPLFTSLANDTRENFLTYLLQKPIYKREFRHSYLDADKKRVQANISRKWVEKEHE